MSINSKLKQVACEVYIPDSKQLFLDLSENKDSIENELSEKLDWNELSSKKASRIKLSSKGDIFEQDQWLNYHSWMLEKVIDFQDVFSRYIKEVT